MFVGAGTTRYNVFRWQCDIVLLLFLLQGGVRVVRRSTDAAARRRQQFARLRTGLARLPLHEEASVLMWSTRCHRRRHRSQCFFLSWKSLPTCSKRSITVVFCWKTVLHLINAGLSAVLLLYDYYYSPVKCDSEYMSWVHQFKVRADECMCIILWYRKCMIVYNITVFALNIRRCHSHEPPAAWTRLWFDVRFWNEQNFVLLFLHGMKKKQTFFKWAKFCSGDR